MKHYVMIITVFSTTCSVYSDQQQHGKVEFKSTAEFNNNNFYYKDCMMNLIKLTFKSA